MEPRIRLSPYRIRRLFSFLGYGNPRADLWFIGLEEGGGSDAEVVKRSRFRTVEDLRSAHGKLGLLQFFIGRRPFQPTWRGLSYVALAYRNRRPTKEAARRYQASRLGRTGGETFLTELYPLPHKSLRDWDYRHLVGGPTDPDQYRAELFEFRKALLKKALTRNRPRLVLAYGKRSWNQFMSLFPRRRFVRLGSFMVSRGHPSIVLSPHITAREMNKGLRDLTKYVSNRRWVSTAG